MRRCRVGCEARCIASCYTVVETRCGAEDAWCGRVAGQGGFHPRRWQGLGIHPRRLLVVELINFIDDFDSTLVAGELGGILWVTLLAEFEE